MAAAADLRALEDSCPWLAEDWQADLSLLAGGTAAASRMFAADMRVIARLAARVPRCAFDETGSTPWTSFRREVAVARKVTDRAAAALIRSALRLTSCLPRAMELLETGVLTPARATALVDELAAVDDSTAGQIDAELADALALLPVWRIEQEIRRAVLRLDPEAAAARTAIKNAERGVQLHPDTDDQACVQLFGPAVPLVRWYATLDARARALKAAGDPRTLDALRFDLASSSYPCDTHTPADPTAPEHDNPAAVDNLADPAGENTAPADGPVPTPLATSTAPGVDNPADPASENAAAVAVPVPAAAPAGLRPSFIEAAPVDCRMSRPVQASIVLPVETALGLSNEPGWLDGYGWLSAPTSRQLLLDAELRRVCARTSTGELVDLADRDLRPPPTPSGVRLALLDMVLGDGSGELTLTDDVGWRTEPQHDPTDRLRTYVELRDRFCDGPTGTRTPASRAQLDHTDPWPQGPTAAWNLAARATRTHQHKHRGWTPLRVRTGTLWLSPAGQCFLTPRMTTPPPGMDPAGAGHLPQLPDPDELHHLDQLQLTDTDDPPHLPAAETDQTQWVMLDADQPPPF